MSAQPMERALQKEVRELREVLVAAEAVVEAARKALGLYDRYTQRDVREGFATTTGEALALLYEALAVFDGLARSGTNT